MMFTGYLLFTMGTDTFMECIAGMLALEPTHTAGGLSRLLSYLGETVELILILAVVGVMGFLASLLPFRTGRGKNASRSAIWLLYCTVILLAGFLLNIISAENRGAYGIIFLALVGAGFRNRHVLSGMEKQIYVCGSVIGVSGFIATLLLTDLWILVSIPYGLLAAVAALIPLAKQADGMISYTPHSERIPLLLPVLYVSSCFPLRIYQDPADRKGTDLLHPFQNVHRPQRLCNGAHLG
ncbi:MAG: hypothetical protein NC121_09110 [Blautia sp.]|nr:hypothetical protein [Blautia sp.]